MIARLLTYCSPRARRLLVTQLILVVVAALVQGVAFVLLLPALRALFVGQPVGGWLLALAGVALIYAGSSWWASRVGMLAGPAICESLLDSIGERLVQLPVAWFGADRAGQLSALVTQGIAFVAAAPYAIVRPMITGFLTPTTVLIGTFFVDVRLGMAMAITLPLMWLVFRWLQRCMARGDAEHAQASAKASNRIIEFARLQSTLRAARDQSVATTLVDQALQQQDRAYRGMLVTGSSAIAAFTGVVQLALTSVIVVGSSLVLGAKIDAATLIAVLVVVVRFVEPIINSGALGGGIAVARTTLDQLDELHATGTLVEPAQPAEIGGLNITFDDVTFSYRDKPVLSHLSFEAPAGCLTAIVGPSGAGKTTIIKLIARFHDPDSGTVSLGKVALTELGSMRVEELVAPVFQDVYLFDDTIINNVWIGNPACSRDEVIEAATRARVDEITERLPGGWDARVGEGGANLSGGERQRVSIARALLKDAPVVLLDEATAALDIGNEQAIGQAIEAIRADRTIVVVAHRLQTIMAADHIIMLDAHGRIAEQGSHSQLVAADGEYARYWNQRMGATRWRLAAGHNSPSPERTSP